MPKFAIIGLGQFGQALAGALGEAGAEVIAIDRDAGRVESVRDLVTLAVRLDSTNEDALRSQGVHEVDVAIVGIGEAFESNVLTVATLRSMGTRRIIARAENEVQSEILRRIGADEVVAPERESAAQWAHRLMLPNLQQYVDLGEHHGMVHALAPTAFHHKTLAQISLRNTYHVNLVAIKRRVTDAADESKGGRASVLIAIPTADTEVLPDDILILVGTNDALDEVLRD